MALRMVEYKIGIYRTLKRFPRQILLYIGESAMHMPLELGDEDLRFQYHAVDIRSLDSEELLSSD